MDQVAANHAMNRSRGVVVFDNAKSIAATRLSRPLSTSSESLLGASSMKSFSFRTILVVVAFVALLLSHALTSARLLDATRELDVVRRNYGYMKIENASKINVVSLAQEEGAFRFVIPPGERYYLHLSETNAKNNSDLPTGRHKTTIALNSWADGEDTILRFGMCLNPDDETPYLEVGSQNQGFFTYRPENWPSAVSLSSVYQLEASNKLELPVDKPIILLRAKSDEIDRGIVLWLESETHRKVRGS